MLKKTKFPSSLYALPIDTKVENKISSSSYSKMSCSYRAHSGKAYHQFVNLSIPTHVIIDFENCV